VLKFYQVSFLSAPGKLVSCSSSASFTDKL